MLCFFTPSPLILLDLSFRMSDAPFLSYIWPHLCPRLPFQPSGERRSISLVFHSTCPHLSLSCLSRPFSLSLTDSRFLLRSCGVLSRLRRMESGAAPKQYSQLLACMCSWGQAGDIIELVTDWLTEALPKKAVSYSTHGRFGRLGRTEFEYGGCTISRIKIRIGV